MSDLLTIRDVATIMKCSEDSVTRLFAKMPGVIDWGRAETRGKRRYRKLLIPKAVLEFFLSKKAGKTVTVTVPQRPERRRKSDGWEERAIANLAKAALQNECKDRKAYERIARRARLLAVFVPESEWSEVNCSWLDNDED